MAGLASKIAALAFCAGVGAFLVPGCVIRIGPGTGEDEQTQTDPTGGTGTTGSTGGQAGAGGGKLTPEEQAALETFEALQQSDPQGLAFASARAGYTTYYMAAMLDSLGLDPATLDEATLDQLIAQYMPLAAQEADNWLATVDPSTLPLSFLPRYECTDQWGCPYSSKCPDLAHVPNHMCFVTDCGDAKCGICPDIIGYFFSHIILKAWCAYVCAELGTSPPRIVGIGAAGVSAFKGYVVGPRCLAQ